jgi:hypothetical protein
MLQSLRCILETTANIMNVLDLPPEVAESCLEMAIVLSQAAQGHGDLLHAASFVHRCYVRAVTPSVRQRDREPRWRRFITSLRAYLEQCSDSPESRRLSAIVGENADLLEHEAALAS